MRKITILLIAFALLTLCSFQLTAAGQLSLIDMAALFTCLLSSALLIFTTVKKDLKPNKNDLDEQLEKIENISSRIEQLENHIKNQCIKDPVLLPKITNRSTENSFHFLFRQKYPGFIPRLRIIVPDITPGEEYLCMMIKLNMTTWEMAEMLGIDIKSIHTSRARLKRKLRLHKEVKINDWVNNINV